MGYGFKVWDGNGQVQFNSEDPAMWGSSAAADQQNSTPTFQSGETGADGQNNWIAYYDDSDLTNLDADADLLFVRPNGDTASGIAGGYLVQNTVNYRYYTGQTFEYFSTTSDTTANGSIVCPSNFKIYYAKGSEYVTPGTTGYGLNVFDGSGNCTFSSNPGGNWDGWFSIVNITASGSSTGTQTPKGKEIYSTTSDTEYAELYVIINNHNFNFLYKNNPLPPGEPTGRYIDIDTGSYYFEKTSPGGKIYAMDWGTSYNLYNFSTDFDGQTGFKIAESWISYNSTFTRDYYVARLVGSAA